HIFLSHLNYLNRPYLTLEGERRCDSFWASVDAWTGEIAWITPAPCSRPSSLCDPISPDTFLAGILPASTLNFDERRPERNAAHAFACPDAGDDRSTCD